METEARADIDHGITLGSTGQRTRWSLSAWGSLTPWGQDRPVVLDWFVAADDRWHIPAQEPTVRQERIEGAPVVETRLRVPDGDVVQRVWAVPDGGGTVVIEFENESPMPCAIAVSGPRVVTERPPADVPIEGIELDDDAIVLPLGHRAVVRVALPHPDGSFVPSSLARVPPALAVVRGWTRVVEQASRMVLPDEGLVHAVVAARCDLLLEGPVDAESDPVGFLLDVAELVRCGDDADAWLPVVVPPAERLARLAAKRTSSSDDVSVALQALEAAAVVAHRAGDRRAAGDIERTIERVESKRTEADDAIGVISSFADARRATSVGRFVRSVERRIVDRDRILVGGMPTSWLGSNFEVHGIPTGATSSVSFGVRWHGERPAVLWEQHGDSPVRLRAPDIDPSWDTSDVSGESLWPAPASNRPTAGSLNLTIDPGSGASFS